MESRINVLSKALAAEYKKPKPNQDFIRENLGYLVHNENWLKEMKKENFTVERKQSLLMQFCLKKILPDNYAIASGVQGVSISMPWPHGDGVTVLNEDGRVDIPAKNTAAPKGAEPKCKSTGSINGGTTAIDFAVKKYKETLKATAKAKGDVSRLVSTCGKVSDKRYADVFSKATKEVLGDLEYTKLNQNVSKDSESNPAGAARE